VENEDCIIVVDLESSWETGERMATHKMELIYNLRE